MVTRETPAASAQATTVTPRAFRRSRSRAPRRSRSACCSGLVYGLGAGMFLILVIRSLKSIMRNASRDLTVKRTRPRAVPADDLVHAERGPSGPGRVDCVAISYSDRLL